jgi:hypothetical protein
MINSSTPRNTLTETSPILLKRPSAEFSGRSVHLPLFPHPGHRQLVTAPTKKGLSKPTLTTEIPFQPEQDAALVGEPETSRYTVKLGSLTNIGFGRLKIHGHKASFLTNIGMITQVSPVRL